MININAGVVGNIINVEGYIIRPSSSAEGYLQWTAYSKKEDKIVATSMFLQEIFEFIEKKNAK